LQSVGPVKRGNAKLRAPSVLRSLLESPPPFPHFFDFEGVTVLKFDLESLPTSWYDIIPVRPRRDNISTSPLPPPRPLVPFPISLSVSTPSRTCFPTKMRLVRSVP